MEKEYESKSYISAKEAQYIRNYMINNLIDTKVQTNLYIDTIDNFYKSKNAALRIRILNNTIELTLKVRDDNGNTEFNNFINDDIQNEILNGNTNILKKFNHPFVHENQKLKITKIVTKRSTYKFGSFSFELDESIFDKTVDYEIEVEASSLKESYNNLMKVLNYFEIKYEKSEPKIERYFKYNLKI